MAAVTIPVMAKCRIGHFAEARVLEALGVDFIDESEVLTPADEAYHVDKHAFTVPFVCGAATWARPCAASAKARRWCAPRARRDGQHRGGVRHMRAVTSAIRRLAHWARKS
jgi:pyridoxal 5'-phosphate synthase pdxS subunit